MTRALSRDRAYTVQHSQMNRRGFLQSLLAVPALTLALAKKPEPALCKCGKPMPAEPPPFDIDAHYIRPAAAALAKAIDDHMVDAYRYHLGRMPAPAEIFIASGGQGYVLSLRPASKFQFSELSVAEAW